MSVDIQSVAVIGGGTMGSGIAALSASLGLKVLLIDVDQAATERGLARAVATAQSPDEAARLKERISTGTITDDLARISESDWICEAIVENLDAKRELFPKIEAARRPGSLVSTNTSGIRLSDIVADLPRRLREEIVVTHFFNPVRVMRLLEIVPGADTRADVVKAFETFGREKLGKGVVRAKDTVNFIANRIGCFFMLSGLHKAEPYLAQGLTQETIDALLGAPVGLPSTGLYGLIDLIGLDVMDLVGRNLAANLPAGDPGLAFARFPARAQAMLERGQLGRKTGGGFTRVTKAPDGAKLKEVFDLGLGQWRPAREAALAADHMDAAGLVFSEDAAGRFVWEALGGTLLYAADLVPQISDDIVNIDRAMRWGFAWRRGPFELLDEIGPQRVIDRLTREGKPLPRLLETLADAREPRFYRDGAYLGVDGRRHPVPPE